MIRERNYSLDVMRFFAAIMITNSHFIPLYKNVNVGLATFGVHGNALFFFVAGFLLTMSMERKKERFDNWYKKRINRLLPALLVWYLFVMDSVERGNNFILQIWSKYWFVNCIFIYYLVFYFYERLIIHQSKIVRYTAFLLPLLISILYAFFLCKKQKGQYFILIGTIYVISVL